MSAHAIGHVHRPVQTLVDTSISFSRLPQAKKKCKQIPPSAPHLKHRLIQCVNSVFRCIYSVLNPEEPRIVQKVENKIEAPGKPAQMHRSSGKPEEFSTDLRPSLHRLKGTAIDRL